MKAERIYTTNEMPDDKRFTIFNGFVILFLFIISPIVVWGLLQFITTTHLLWFGFGCLLTCAIWSIVELFKNLCR